jgi:lysozyme family protein
MFDRAFKLIIGHEGGYVDDPVDPGGETKWGISRRAYPGRDIKNMTLTTAKQIYRADYWDKCRCAQMPWSLAVMIFDCAVNQGPGVAIKYLQDAVGTTPDGQIGPVTLQALAAAQGDGYVLSREVALDRIMRYTSTDNFGRYGRGWIRRTLETLTEGVK